MRPSQPTQQQPDEGGRARAKRPTRQRIEFEFVGSEATRQLGIRISESLAMRVDVAAMKGKLGKRRLCTARAIVEHALEQVLDELEAA